MNSHFKFPRRVRIHGGECGAVARALHHAAQKGVFLSHIGQTLISDECSLLRQAELEKASGSTLDERKQMSTKTSIKRIALVAVSALGFGLLSVMPANAVPYRATFTAPSSYDVLTAGTVGTARNVGSIQIDLATLSTGALTNNLESASVTIAAGTTAGSADLLAALSLSNTSATGTGDVTTAGTGYNALNNGTVDETTADRVMRLRPSAAGFSTASGRQYLLFTPAQGITYVSGATVTFTLSVTGAEAGNGVLGTFQQTLTLSVGTKPGTGSTPVTTGTIRAGATATVTHTQPYTNVAANSTISPVAFSITDTVAAAAGDPTFSVTAVVTGGSAVMVRTNATTITPTLLKDGLDGSLSVTYTLSVTAPAGAVAGETISLYGYTWTVQPYTPVYASSVVTPTAIAGQGFRISAANGGDGIFWAAASNTNQIASITVQQIDQTNANISAAYATPVTATITGKGSLAALGANGATTKSQAWNSTLGNLAGLTTITVFSDGTSGEGSLVITVNGATVATYTLRFFGDAATISASLLRPIGSTTAATVNGTAGTPVATTAIAGVTPNTVGADTVTAIAVSVKDANGYTIPTSVAPTATISDISVISGVSRSFVDSGVTLPLTLQYSAGTFVQHYTYTSAGNTSGKTATLTFTFVNAAGTALTATPVTVTLGGSASKATLTFDKTTYSPGQAATLTFAGTDSAGNKVADGQNLIAGGMESTLDFGTVVIANNSVLGGFSTAPTVDGKRSRATFAPTSPGTWTITAYLANGTSYSATATVTDPAAAATAAGNAATTAAKEAIDAANAAADAAAEAIDAANAATDAANLAAEAADAATVAAEEARDAADAATAAVEELATQVATLMAALKAQITTLANTVAKIAKKVKA